MSLSWQDFWGPADLINCKHISWLITIPVIGGDDTRIRIDHHDLEHRPACRFFLRQSYFQERGRLRSSAHPTICQVRSGRCLRLCELLLSARSAKKASHMHTHTPSDPISEPFWVMHYKVSWKDPDSLPSLFLYSILSSNTFLRDKFASICLLLLLQLFSWLSSTMLDCQ